MLKGLYNSLQYKKHKCLKLFMLIVSIFVNCILQHLCILCIKIPEILKFLDGDFRG